MTIEKKVPEDDNRKKVPEDDGGKGFCRDCFVITFLAMTIKKKKLAMT